MKTAAIIAEYNPFHNGHAYQIAQTKEVAGADYVLVLMSGDFVQRGTPALCNKYLRTQMALLGGADVVLELPSLYAVSSAEFFAGGGVTLLNNLGVIQTLSFGSESGAIDELRALAGLLVQEPAKYRNLLSSFLKNGEAFPVARAKALTESLPDSFPVSHDNVKKLLSSPNNILGLEYCKALSASSSAITPVTIKRLGSGYHDTTIAEGFSSASAIRTALFSETASVKGQIPPESYELLFKEQNPVFLCSNDFSLLLHYKLLSEKETGFADYLDCNQDISDKICKLLPDYRDYDSFCDCLKSRDLTYTRISRILLHILLNIKTPESYQIPIQDRRLRTPYARLLGFKKEAAPLLNAIKKESSIPLISKLADAKKLLSDEDYSMLQQDIYTSNLYEAVYASKRNTKPLNEYKQSPIIL